MKRTEVKIKSESSYNEMTILLDESGDIHIGLHGAITIKGKGSKINSDVYESLLDIINTIEHDVPIGNTVTIKGREYTCKEAPDDGWDDDPCDICAFGNRRDICMKYAFRCVDEERADNTNIIFE